jgi:hypothetical protein
MKKLGPIEFRQITALDELERAFEEMIPYHDARHLAIRGSAPFTDHPELKRFGLALLSAPGLQHASVMRVGGQFASMIIGVPSGRELQLGLVAHNPALAKCSPGKFHIFFLARKLIEQGFERLDLTAGGDAYKDRFANDADDVYTLTIYRSLPDRMLGALRARAKSSAKKFLTRFDLDPNDLRSKLRNWRHGTIPFSDEVRASDHPNHNRLADLLTYRPRSGEMSRQRFMSHAIRQIEAGEQFHTLVRDGKLQAIAWKPSERAPEPDNVKPKPPAPLPRRQGDPASA